MMSDLKHIWLTAFFCRMEKYIQMKWNSDTYFYPVVFFSESIHYFFLFEIMLKHIHRIWERLDVSNIACGNSINEKKSKQRKKVHTPFDWIELNRQKLTLETKHCLTLKWNGKLVGKNKMKHITMLRITKGKMILCSPHVGCQHIFLNTILNIE